MIRVALYGYGYWGPNLARNIAATDGLSLEVIQDLDPLRDAAALRAYPRHRLPGRIDAVVIATPVSTHYEIAKNALESGKHVLVAKPLAQTVEQATELFHLAFDHGLVLMVDHTFLYTDAVREIRTLRVNAAVAGGLGDILYLDSVRVNLGLVQQDVDVLWDLAAHDVSIFNFVMGRPPISVSAVGFDPLGYGRATGAHLTMWWDAEIVGHVHVNWLSPVKVRRMMVAGSRRTAVWDDVEPTEKLRVYDSGVDLGVEGRQVDYRVGDMVAPKLDTREALAVELEWFAHLIESGTHGLKEMREALEVVRVLEAASRSAAENGRRWPV